MTTSSPLSALPPLKVTCTSTDCEAGLHCFKQKRRKDARTPPSGPCRACGAELVDFERVYQRRPGDVDYTFEALKRECIRHHFWHKKIDEKARNHALRKGRRRLREALATRLQKYVGPSADRLSYDGRQTPMAGNLVFYAQHATACCCRKCIEYWHDIPMDRALTGEEITYLGDLAWRFIMERMPELSEEPVRVPARRRPR